MHAIVIVALALVSLACAQPDAQFYYSYPVPALDPHAKTPGLTTYANGAVVPDDTNAVKIAKAQHFAAKAFDYATRPQIYSYAPYGYLLRKRREAEAEADAQTVYTYPAVTPAVYPTTYGYNPYAVQTYAYTAQPYAYPYLIHG